MAVTAAESPNSFLQSSTERLEVSKFSSLKTLAMPTEATKPAVDVNVPGVLPVGRFSGDDHWPDLSDYRGLTAITNKNALRCLLTQGPDMRCSCPLNYRLTRFKACQLRRGQKSPAGPDCSIDGKTLLPICHHREAIPVPRMRKKG